MIGTNTYQLSMEHAIVQERGQVTIPKPIRDRFGLTAGTELEFREDEGRIVVRKVESIDALDQLYGLAGTGRRTDDVVKRLRGEV